MAFTIISPAVAVNANTIGLGISSTSLFEANVDAVTQSIENLKFLLLTRIGEIPNMSPDFGTRLLFVLFEQNANSADLKETIEEIITSAVTKWVPEIDIEKIDITTSEDNPTLAYDVVIKLTINIDEFLTTATIVTIAANNAGSVFISSQLGS